MNREIKFRIWSIELNKWATDLFLENLSEVKFTTLNGFLSDLECNPSVVVQQYTGLKDHKSGKEIYEGDIVEGYLGVDQIGAGGCVESNEWTFKGVVKFEGCGFYSSEADFPLDQYEFLEVVGNIFENPKLV